MKFFVGIIVIAIGTLLVLKSEWMVQNFDRIDWAEQHLGTEGGTRVFYKLLGVLLIFMAFLGMTGAFNGILNAVFGGAFRETKTTY